MEEKSKNTESDGPAACLKILESQGLGDGPLAKAFRSALEKDSKGALIIASTFREP
jgi:hypothetical protein